MPESKFMKKNVLVFPCGTEIGLEVNRALANSTYFNLIGANSTDDHGKYVYKNYIPNLPYIDDSNFLTVLNEIIEQYQIDFIIPAHDSAVLLMAENQSAINAKIITSPIETCQICRSKKMTYELFQHKMLVPKMYPISSDMEYPVFLKPDVGQGSRGTYKANSKQEVDFYFKKDPTLLALEYLPGKEYTIDCFTDRTGKLLFAKGRERKRISGGISVNSVNINDSRFFEIAHLINETLSFQGVWFYQVKERANGEFVLMEISPRIAGTMGLFRADGVNFAQLSLFDQMGFDVGIINNNLNVEIDRALFSRYKINVDYDYIYIDFDDTIIVNDLVNVEAIHFLYHSKNIGKKIILISKHKFKIQETLARFSISPSLFDEIIILPNDEKKSTYIEQKSSIFIDDSYAERKEVNDQLHIPVFAIDAISALISWEV